MSLCFNFTQNVHRLSYYCDSSITDIYKNCSSKFLYLWTSDDCERSMFQNKDVISSEFEETDRFKGKESTVFRSSFEQCDDL